MLYVILPLMQKSEYGSLKKHGFFFRFTDFAKICCTIIVTLTICPCVKNWTRLIFGRLCQTTTSFWPTFIRIGLTFQLSAGPIITNTLKMTYWGFGSIQGSITLPPPCYWLNSVSLHLQEKFALQSILDLKSELSHHAVRGTLFVCFWPSIQKSNPSCYFFSQLC